MGSNPIGSSNKIYEVEKNMENKESFEELYTRLYNENFSELEERRSTDAYILKKLLTIVLILFAFLIAAGLMMGINIENLFKLDGNMEDALIVVVMAVALVPVIVIILIALVVGVLKNPKTNGEDNKKASYQSAFKEKIVTPIINLVLEDSEYYHNVGLTEEEYNKGQWEKYDRYDSEDKIVTSINNLKLTMSEVHTQDRRRDSDGDTHYVTMFHGLAGYAMLPKDIGCNLRVGKNELNLFGIANDRLEMDMTEFEKMFDVKTDDKIKAMQLLTADIMTEFIELVNTSKVKFEFYINHDIMHIRFHTGEMFEPNIFGKAMQYEMLKKYYDIVGSVKNITEHICNVIINIEV